MVLVVPVLAPGEKVLSSVRRHLDSGDWRIVRYSEQAADGGNSERIRVFHDGQRILTKTGTALCEAVFIRWPYPGRLLAMAEHSSAGHGMTTWLYLADRKGLTDLRVRLNAECNGPVYRDLDHDGRPEIVFDNDDWYEFYGKTPTKLRAFKYDGKRLRLWREFPNRRHERLPFRLPYF